MNKMVNISDLKDKRNVDKRHCLKTTCTCVLCLFT